MQNYKLTIQYSGARYHGWQIQKNAATIQQAVTEAIETVLKEQVNLIGAGRTDTGVHAMGQVANFKTCQELDLYRFLHSLNGILPPDISISHGEQVDENFHSRFDALSREYRYFIYHKKNPFLRNRAYYMRYEPDTKQLNTYSERFLGRHKFYSFAKELPSNENATCVIKKAFWKRSGEMSVFVIEADRFLHGMVRLITGSIIHAAKNDKPVQWIDEMLHNNVENRFAVPPCGLYLYRVNYQ